MSLGPHNKESVTNSPDAQSQDSGANSIRIGSEQRAVGAAFRGLAGQKLNTERRGSVRREEATVSQGDSVSGDESRAVRSVWSHWLPWRGRVPHGGWPRCPEAASLLMQRPKAFGGLAEEGPHHRRGE